jgi:quercetin dioxygenase-like cupin family protein
MVDFSKVEEVTIPHMKGGEGFAKARIVDDGKVKIMRSVLEKGCSIGLHTHTGSAEVIYVLSGEAISVMDGKEETVLAGQAVYCPEGHSHSMMNRKEEPLVCLCVVTKQ